MRRLTLLLAGLALVACGDDDEPAAEPEEFAEETPHEPPEERPLVDDDPLAGLDEVENLQGDEATAAAALRTDVEVPPRGCAFADEGPVLLWRRPGIAAMTAVGDGFAIAGYGRKEDGSEEIFLLHLVPGRMADLILRRDLEHSLRTARVAPPGLAARDGGRVGLAYTDGRAQVHYARLGLGDDRGHFVVVGQGADQRYAPAVGFRDADDLVAWADGSGADHARVQLARLLGGTRVSDVRDVTPDASGATAPIVVGDTLLYADHRQGISSLYTVQLPDGQPEVLRPVSHLFDPVALAAARWNDRWLVGYTAVGSAAQTAVGLVVADGDRTPPPAAIVPSSGYGMLHVAATQLAESVVFVADASTAPERESPRRLDVRVAWSDATMGEPLSIQGPEGTEARFGTTAAHGGVVGVAFGSPDGVYLRLLRCDPGAG
ncbi:MAG: hypothetical protein CMN30_01905 [Sandaracinus sp.]|nr:hypothetical protein [Sandaracinus sp.]